MSTSGTLSVELGMMVIKTKSSQLKVEGASANRRPEPQIEKRKTELSLLVSPHLPVLVPQKMLLPDMLAAIQVT